MISSPDLICRNARRAMFQYPAHRITRATTSRGTKQHVRTSIRIPDLLSPAQTGLDPDQASPRRDRSLLRGTLPADQLALSSRPGTISHVWSPYTWCLTSICVAATPASPDLVQELSSDQNLKLEVVDSNFFDGCDVLALGSVRVDPRCSPAQLFEYLLDDR